MSDPQDVSGPQHVPGPQHVLRSRWPRRLGSWWLKVVVIFAASRLVSTALLVVFAAVQGPNPWTGAHPGYFDFASIWDGRWYDIVASSGYPSQLQYDANGHIEQNAWAFLPGYPWLVGVVMFVTRMPWGVASVLVSLAFALGTALVLYKLFRLRFGASIALFAVALYCFSPTSPLLQLAYAESMYLFFLALALYFLMQRRYLLLLPVILLDSFVRPGSLAFALAVVLHVIYRWIVHVRHPERDSLSVADRVSAVVAAVFSALAGLAWPALAALATGSLTAYTDTELAWRADYIGYGPLTPFTPWIAGAKWWFTTWSGLPEWFGYLMLALVVAIFAVTLFLPTVRRLGVDLRFWLVAYALYLLAVWFPQSSTFRLLMPMFPLLGALAIVKNKAYRTALIVVCIAGQVGWLLLCWGVDGYDWSPP